jgi:GNAT superfamily N-acetyltransferase
MTDTKIFLRTNVLPNDPEVIETIVRSSGFFHEEEIQVAAELAQETLIKGPSSGYHFIFAQKNDLNIGYSCFGAIPCTKSSYDLYWIAVLESERGSGIGKLLLTESEKRIKTLGGTRIYIETSSRPLYEPTRQFYLRCGYTIATILEDFYAPSDGKVIFVKAL